jgi:hypothetical protein
MPPTILNLQSKISNAQIHGASAIAVATGTFPLKELEKTEAELVIADLSNTAKIVDWIRRK